MPQQLLSDTVQIADSMQVVTDDKLIPSIEDLLERCIANYATIDDYICIFHKIERIDDELIEEKDILYKFKKPLNFYLKFPSGGEAIYVQGKYDNELQFHSGNIFGFIVFSLDPSGGLAMQDNRHSILDSHIGHIIGIIDSNYKRAINNDELITAVEGKEILKGSETLLFQAIFPENKDYYGHIININMDIELYLPVKIEVYGWALELLEMYHFSNLEINVGLNDMDFDVNNPEYDF
jgi:hypothetical protein